jgi:hypothetical protein
VCSGRSLAHLGADRDPPLCAWSSVAHGLPVLNLYLGQAALLARIAQASTLEGAEQRHHADDDTEDTEDPDRRLKETLGVGCYRRVADRCDTEGWLAC